MPFASLSRWNLRPRACGSPFRTGEIDDDEAAALHHGIASCPARVVVRTEG